MRSRPASDPSCCPWPIVIIGAGLLRLALTVSRRVIAGKVSLGVEFDLRERMYGHLMALELGFFDRQQTGQLMSRATVDLQAVRFFLGYGLIFMTQYALTILLAGAVMFFIEPWLALIALAPVPARGLGRGPLLAIFATGAPGGPAADRRADRRRRGGNLGHPRGQGVCP